MYRKVENWIDAVELEHEIQKFWDETKAFEKLRKKNAGNKHWSFLDGPITANNPMGVHHAWGRTLKDVFQRYYAMNGYELRYQNGFDCQGLWVEVEVEKELGFKTKLDIEKYGIGSFVDKCKSRVKKFSKIQTEQSIRLGYWMDWDNSYYTMSDENNFTIWKFLKKCNDRGLIYKGYDVMPWCTRCATGLSQHELHEGYEETIHTSVFVKFPLRGRKNEALIVWTTTLWTLTSNIAAAVHPELDYVKVRQGDWIYYLAEQCAERVLTPLGKYEILKHFKGSELVGLSYDGPFDELPIQQETSLKHPVIGWKEVNATEGTGIVHIAPGCGKEDNELGKQKGLDLIAPINDMGIFYDKFDWISGKDALSVGPEIQKNLVEKGVLYNSEQYKHSYPHCWRCGSELLFRYVDEWFISMDPWRGEIKNVAKKINWIPSYGLDLELDWLNNMHDWMISKKRYWGLALPIWKCNTCGNFDVIGSKEELQEKAIEGWEEFEGHSPHRPWIDKVVTKCSKCGEKAYRISDVGNPWLDAGIVPYSTVNYNQNRDYWKKWIPADLVLECFPGQFRNWFYSLLAMSTMMENLPPFKTLLGHALVRDENADEMHKSKGNAIWFDDAVEKMSADVMRWIYCGQETTVNLNFGFKIAREVRGKFYNKLWNIYSFFINYARIINFTPPEEPTPIEKRSNFDRWILSDLQLTILKVRKGIEDYNLRSSARAIEEFVENLSNWYIRHSRRRFWRGDNDQDALLAYETLYESLFTLIKLLAPFMPFVTEKIYQNLVRSHSETSPESIHHNDYPDVVEKWIDKDLSNEMDIIIHITWLALSAREAARMKVRQPLAELFISPSEEIEVIAANRFKDMLMDDLNVKNVTILPIGTPNPSSAKVNLNFKSIGKKLGPRMKEMQSYIKTHNEDLTKEFQTNEEIINVILNGENFTLTHEDFKLELTPPENRSIAEDKGIWVAFDTSINEDLKLEGMMRDLLRRLQVLRKDEGLEIEDTIALSYATDDSDFNIIMERWKDFLASELLATEITKNVLSADAKSINLGEKELRVMIQKTGKLKK